MNIFVTASKGSGDAAAKYIDALRAPGHTVSTEGTDALLAADALFLCIAGEDNAAVKADLNLLLDCGVPVAYVLEGGVTVDQGLSLQLGLATSISPGHYEHDLAQWLGSVGGKKKKRRGPKGAIAVCAVVLICVAATVLWKTLPDHAEPAADAFAEEPIETGTDYFGGAAPETLTTLDLSGSGLTDIAFLARAVNLEELDLSDNELSDISPLSSLTKLKRLNISNNRITDINVLLALTSLEEVNVSGNPIEDRAAFVFLPGVRILE